MIRPCARLFIYKQSHEWTLLPCFNSSDMPGIWAQRNTGRRPSWGSRTHVLVNRIQQDQVHSYILSFFFFAITQTLVFQSRFEFSLEKDGKRTQKLSPPPTVTGRALLSQWSPAKHSHVLTPCLSTPLGSGSPSPGQVLPPGQMDTGHPTPPEGCLRNFAPARKAGTGRGESAQRLLFNDLDNRADWALSLPS